MRSLVLFTIGGALLLIALATGCKSDKPAAKAAASATEAGGAGSQAGQPDDPVPAVPVPRRMRSSQSPGEAAPPRGEGRRAWGGPRGEEVRQRIAEMRKQYDANGDGQLDGDERDAFRQARIKERMARIDSDGDGTISRQEAETAPFGRMLRDFDAVDANQDSVVSSEELEAAISERQARRTERMRERQGAE